MSTAMPAAMGTPDPRMLANAIRFLSIAAIERATEGHQGIPLGMAEIATALFTRHMKFNAKDPQWPDRDRFVLSNSHGSMLLNSLLHLTGYKHFPLDQIKSFREMGSHCAGHPEYDPGAGIEVTTGPLGQGIANALGMALAEAYLNARFGSGLVDHHTYAFVGDGCLQEGIGQEVISLTGHLKLGKLVFFWDGNKVPLPGAVLERLPDLKLVAVAATGTDCVDKAWCRQRGIAVANIRGYAVSTVPEHTFALILALRRSIIGFREDVLGQRVADIARAFGMVPQFAAHKGKSGLGPLYTPWDEVLETSDVITLHSPLTPETKGMIALPEFRRMKRQPLIVNTTRGGLVIEEDLVTVLDEGLISGAGFDVTFSEPPQEDNPLMRVADRPNVILTPHVAWASDEVQQTLADQLVDNIENFVNGTPSNLVRSAY